MRPTILEMSVERLARVERFCFDELPDESGRIEIYEDPNPEHQYVAGADFALGLEGRDYDAAVILDITPQPAREVMELHGHWGEDFARILFAALCYFNEAFLVGERQFGLPWLRALLNDYGYGHLFYDRDEAARSRKITDKLGYFRSTNDVCIPNLRRALRDQLIEIRSATLMDQLRSFQYAPKSKSMEHSEAQDKHLGMELKGGGSPDLVMAAGYAWHAAREVPHYEKPPRKYHPRSLGAILEHDLLDGPKDPGSGWRRAREARKRR